MLKNLFYDKLTQDCEPVDFGTKKYGLPGLPSEERCNCDIEELKTCGRCIHDEESATDNGSPCYLCQRNSYDNRIDKWEVKQ